MSDDRAGRSIRILAGEAIVSVLGCGVAGHSILEFILVDEHPAEMSEEGGRQAPIFECDADRLFPAARCVSRQLWYFDTATLAIRQIYQLQTVLSVSDIDT
ncbi:hypothetical protein BIWAKO_06670 [Bosea sp. BIWAKO-01]|nr:hypothetical protein BIWAKO_06670 [Bosea sp. BIWAKO-01]